jgi:hypothetical protein
MAARAVNSAAVIHCTFYVTEVACYTLYLAYAYTKRLVRVQRVPRSLTFRNGIRDGDRNSAASGTHESHFPRRYPPFREPPLPRILRISHLAGS